jgi:hypothetical protein
MNDWPSGPRRLALTHQMDAGNISGFSRKQGDGWILFEDCRTERDYARRINQDLKRYEEIQQRWSEVGEL